MKYLFLFTAFAFLASCKSTFQTVEFKYDNLAHMSPTEATVVISAKPEDLIFVLSQSFQRQNNLILNRRELDFYLTPSSDRDACSIASREIWSAEFQSYEANSFKQYESIDRKGIFDKHDVSENCSLFDMEHAGEFESWFLRVEIPQGNYTSTISVPDIESFIGFSGSRVITANSISSKDRSVTTGFASNLYVYAWRLKGSEMTNVYLLAKPVNDQVESCSGCSIGKMWWKQANGYAEYKLVSKYKFLLEDLARDTTFLTDLNEEM